MYAVKLPREQLLLTSEMLIKKCGAAFKGSISIYSKEITILPSPFPLWHFKEVQETHTEIAQVIIITDSRINSWFQQIPEAPEEKLDTQECKSCILWEVWKLYIKLLHK